MSAKDESRAERDLLKKSIGITLSALVVLGAGIAILQVDASINESNTARETTRVAVRAMRANVVASQVAGLEPELQAERDFLSFRRPLSPGVPTLATAAGLPPSAGPPTVNPTVDRSVPDLGVGPLLTSLQIDAARLKLKQRALATTRITWNDRSTQYTTVIAVLAVALFLVGFGLVVEGPIRRAAYTLGLAVGIFAALWAAWFHHLPIPHTADRAIEAAARGAVLSANGDYRAALAQYDAAVHADADFAAAYSGRSRARLLAANPDYPVTRAVTEATGRPVAAAVRDARRALKLDDRDIQSIDLLALTSFYDNDYAQTVSAVDRAIAVNSGVPDLWLLRSAAQAALGDRSRAEASLNLALAPLRGTQPSQRTRLLASTYLSYLAWVERHVPARAQLARRLADRLVALETRFTLRRPIATSTPPKKAVDVQNLRFVDGRLMFRLDWRNLPPATAVSAIGYEQPRRDAAWSQPAALALFATLAGTGERTVAVPLRRACKPTAVRVDVYLNGTRTLSRVGPGVAPTC